MSGYSDRVWLWLCAGCWCQVTWTEDGSHSVCSPWELEVVEDENEGKLGGAAASSSSTDAGVSGKDGATSTGCFAPEGTRVLACC